MRMLLIGYGKMGQAIEKVALRRGHVIVHKIDRDNHPILANIDPRTVDVALEFSQPKTAYHNILQCLIKDIPVIAGTTGWLAKKEDVYAYCNAHQSTFFYASNFSIGMHLLFKVNIFLAKLMDHQPEYEVTLTEQHHVGKQDAPSGTAITLAENIVQNVHRKKRWELTPMQQEDSLGITVQREKDIPGIHTITYQSPQDTIVLQHTTHNRESFALGAVWVAEWMQGKQGILGMQDFLATYHCTL